MHDLVERPRYRWWHDYSRCGWHYEDFAIAPGRALYRWQVDRLLTRFQVGLQLADSGEDVGRLVRVAGDERDQLVQAVLRTTNQDDRVEVQHAVALFRGRTASREGRRSAVVALARVLEHRKRLLKKELLSKDESALFHIANQFDLRHRDHEQQGDYDAAFLDWVFWWYLATVDLVDQLLARQRPTT